MADRAKATFYTVGSPSGRAVRNISIGGGSTIKVISETTLRNALREANKELRTTQTQKPKRTSVD